MSGPCSSGRKRHLIEAVGRGLYVVVLAICGQSGHPRNLQRMTMKKWTDILCEAEGCGQGIRDGGSFRVECS